MIFRKLWAIFQTLTPWQQVDSHPMQRCTNCISFESLNWGPFAPCLVKSVFFLVSNCLYIHITYLVNYIQPKTAVPPIYILIKHSSSRWIKMFLKVLVYDAFISFNSFWSQFSQFKTIWILKYMEEVIWSHVFLPLLFDIDFRGMLIFCFHCSRLMLHLSIKVYAWDNGSIA